MEKDSINFSQDDVNNLRFLLLSSKETLADWYSKISDEEKLYAEWLVRNAPMTLAVQIFSETLSYDEPVEDVTEAKEYLSSFTLGGKVK
jgi:hypothetical protein